MRIPQNLDRKSLLRSLLLIASAGALLVLAPRFLSQPPEDFTQVEATARGVVADLAATHFESISEISTGTIECEERGGEVRWHTDWTVVPQAVADPVATVSEYFRTELSDRTTWVYGSEPFWITDGKADRVRYRFMQQGTESTTSWELSAESMFCLDG